MLKNNFLTRAWHGKAMLWEAWLLVGIVVILFIYVILNGINYLLIRAIETYGWPISLKYYWHYFSFIVGACAQIAWWRMGWICAENPKKTIWSTIVKIFIVLAILRTIGHLSTMFGPNY